MIHEEENKKITQLENEATSGEKIMGGGFADITSQGEDSNAPVDPFVAPTLVNAEDPMGGYGFVPVDEDPLGPPDPNELDPINKNSRIFNT